MKFKTFLTEKEATDYITEGKSGVSILSNDEAVRLLTIFNKLLNHNEDWEIKPKSKVYHVQKFPNNELFYVIEVDGAYSVSCIDFKGSYDEGGIGSDEFDELDDAIKDLKNYI